MKKQTWIFYFTRKKNPLLMVFESANDCVYPERTARWKMLQRDLQEEQVHSVGYMLASDFIKERELAPETIDSVERYILDQIKKRL